MRDRVAAFENIV